MIWFWIVVVFGVIVWSQWTAWRYAEDVRNGKVPNVCPTCGRYTCPTCGSGHR